ncbi:hypothetical protein BDV36DRAFT_264358 [Aspergillus pseudocaelatus]|uniref:Uncharacterized protein n=1 Tax=Aspergillus pseudocaelatus TaxID=1825620 RepID=A0ABQ6WC93_9EURO|nr:hypothetical protein BDV36DRAFT_264358 [Aspergillus pseudocaelatus]
MYSQEFLDGFILLAMGPECMEHVLLFFFSFLELYAFSLLIGLLNHSILNPTSNNTHRK